MARNGAQYRTEDLPSGRVLLEALELPLPPFPFENSAYTILLYCCHFSAAVVLFFLHITGGFITVPMTTVLLFFSFIFLKSRGWETPESSLSPEL